MSSPTAAAIFVGCASLSHLPPKSIITVKFTISEMEFGNSVYIEFGNSVYINLIVFLHLDRLGSVADRV